MVPEVAATVPLGVVTELFVKLTVPLVKVAPFESVLIVSALAAVKELPLMV